MSVIFELRDVSVAFGDDRVLAGVDLDIERREFVSLLGASGCGKSTILNVAAGLLAVERGTAYFDSRPIDGVNRRVGYMTQGDTLLPWRTVESNVGLPLRIRGVPKREIATAVERFLSLLELEHAADLYPAQLSGGMRRRALLARSMIYEPELLLMDEPFAALDAQLRTQMHAELLRAVNKTGQTVLFVTHDVTEAALLSDRVLIIGGGRPAGVTSEQAIEWGDDREVESLRYQHGFADVELELHQSLQRARHHAGIGEGAHVGI